MCGNKFYECMYVLLCVQEVLGKLLGPLLRAKFHCITKVWITGVDQQLAAQYFRTGRSS